MRIRLSSLAAAFVVLLGSTPVFAATTWFVDASAPGPGNGTALNPYTTISAALAAATTVSGDTIEVAPGDYTGNLTVSKYVTIHAPGGPLATTIRGSASGPVVRITTFCDCQNVLPKIEGFTITGVSGPAGTAAVQTAEGTLLRCIVTGNTGNGYFAYATTWDGFVTNCTFAGNDNGIHSDVQANARVVRTAFRNTNSNHVIEPGGTTSIRVSVGLGLSTAGGSGNLAVDPFFWDAPAGDYHLRVGSPCIRPGDIDIGALPFDPNYSLPSYAFCDGAGSFMDHTTACPCGNVGAAGRGCASGFNAGGALLSTTGSPASDDVVLQGSGVSATALGVFLQHDATDDRVFHDGVTCAGGNLIRLRVRAAAAGVSRFPDPAFAEDVTTTLSQRGSVTPGSGSKRFYSLFYRAPAATFCPPATANSTNGWAIVW